METPEDPETPAQTDDDGGVVDASTDPQSIAPELTADEAEAAGVEAGDQPPVVDGSEVPDESEAEAADYSFDAADAAPDAENIEGLSDEQIEQMKQDQAAESERDEEVKTEAQQEEDEAGRQRRQNVRVNVQLPITVRATGHPEVRARTRDLSATGTGFATRLALDVDTPGNVTIHFDDWNFKADFVVRFVKPILAGKQAGVQFDDISEDERERLVKEVFEIQRTQLQKQRARSGG